MTWPSGPDGYVALPPEERTITTRCVVCGGETTARAIPNRSTTVHPDADGHAARVVPQRQPVRKGLVWPDGAYVGACPSHDQDQVLTALRLRGAAPYGFTVIEAPEEFSG